MTTEPEQQHPTGEPPFPVDWNEWRAEWAAWRNRRALAFRPTSYRFPGRNFLADEILDTWRINGRTVELSEVTFPDLRPGPEHRHQTVRYVGLTFSTGSGTDDGTALAGTFGELDRALGLYECMNCGTIRSGDPAEWESCRDEIGRSCQARP
jgi:hypothetical protein